MVFRRTSSVTHVSWSEADTWIRELASKIPKDKWIWAQHEQDLIAAAMLSHYSGCGFLRPVDDYTAEMKASSTLKFTLTNDRLTDCCLIKYDYDPRLKANPDYYVVNESVDEVETDAGVETFRTQYVWPWNK